MTRTRMMIFGAMLAIATSAGALVLTTEPAYACTGGSDSGGSSDYSWSWSYSW